MAFQRKILVIDDDPIVVQVIGLVLESEGFDVSIASDGVEGLKMTKEIMPDAIILDVKMPKLSGYLMAEMLSRDAKLARIPILLLSSLAKTRGGVEINTPGVKYRLCKPFDHEELLHCVKLMMRRYPYKGHEVSRSSQATPATKNTVAYVKNSWNLS